MTKIAMPDFAAASAGKGGKAPKPPIFAMRDEERPATGAFEGAAAHAPKKPPSSVAPAAAAKKAGPTKRTKSASAFGGGSAPASDGHGAFTAKTQAPRPAESGSSGSAVSEPPRAAARMSPPWKRRSASSAPAEVDKARARAVAKLAAAQTDSERKGVAGNPPAQTVKAEEPTAGGASNPASGPVSPLPAKGPVLEGIDAIFEGVEEYEPHASRAGVRRQGGLVSRLMGRFADVRSERDVRRIVTSSYRIHNAAEDLRASSWIEVARIGRWMTASGSEELSAAGSQLVLLAAANFRAGMGLVTVSAQERPSGRVVPAKEEAPAAAREGKAAAPSASAHEEPPLSARPEPAPASAGEGAPAHEEPASVRAEASAPVCAGHAGQAGSGKPEPAACAKAPEAERASELAPKREAGPKAETTLQPEPAPAPEAAPQPKAAPRIGAAPESKSAPRQEIGSKPETASKAEVEPDEEPATAPATAPAPVLGPEPPTRSERKPEPASAPVRSAEEPDPAVSAPSVWHEASPEWSVGRTVGFTAVADTLDASILFASEEDGEPEPDWLRSARL